MALAFESRKALGCVASVIMFNHELVALKGLHLTESGVADMHAYLAANKHLQLLALVVSHHVEASKPTVMDVQTKLVCGLHWPK